MNERHNEALGFGERQINKEARELLGKRRLDYLGAFSNEEHLQRTFDGFRNNPNSIMIVDSLIGGGNDLLKDHSSVLEAQLHPDDDPDRVPRLSALNTIFRIGFGAVEHTVVSHRVDQGDWDSLTPQAYKEWALLPQVERVEEMKSYLISQEADMLALNFFEEKEGSMMQFMYSITVSTPRVNGEAPHVVDVRQDTGARTSTNRRCFGRDVPIARASGGARYARCG